MLFFVIVMYGCIIIWIIFQALYFFFGLSTRTNCIICIRFIRVGVGRGRGGGGKVRSVSVTPLYCAPSDKGGGNGTYLFAFCSALSSYVM